MQMPINPYHINMLKLRTGLLTRGPKGCHARKQKTENKAQKWEARKVRLSQLINKSSY